MISYLKEGFNKGNPVYPASLLCDFYKVSHKAQYPDNTQVIYSTWTPRMSRIENQDEVVVFGFQGVIIQWLIQYFGDNFFSRPLDEVVNEYKRMIKYTLNVESPDASHIADLHKIGYLPIRVQALPEGTLAPLRVPTFTIVNTLEDDGFSWLTNYLETLLSLNLWKPSTNATIAFMYRRCMEDWGALTSDSVALIPFLGHDFSMRGMDALDAAGISGAAHLLSFKGTDTIPAICYLEAYYGANIETELVGTSIPATEHSVMCAGEDDFATMKRLITEVYPSGFVSIVSDTWDFWKVLSEVLPLLKHDIMKRDGKVVIRPDSGDPVKIICGDPNSDNELERKGAIRVLWELFGGTVNSKGYRELYPTIGLIYGDAITLERCEEICRKLAEKGFASTNVVLGIGSYTYQYNTRDTFGYAMKATYAKINNEEKLLFKDPKTDPGSIKKSQKGLVHVHRNSEGTIEYTDNLCQDEYAAKQKLHPNLLTDLFVDGKLVRTTTLAEIRSRIEENLKFGKVKI